MTPITIDQVIQIAQQHHQAGRLAEAEKIYRQVLAREPNHAQALNLLGLLAGQVGRADAALELIRRAIQIEPQFAEAHGNLGVILEAQGHFDEAIDSHRRAIGIKPGIAEMHIILARALKSAGRLDEAVAAYREAIRLEQNDGAAHANLGGVQNLMGQFDDAIASLRQAVRLQPGLAKAHNNLASTLRDTGRLDEAIASYRQAIQFKPDYAAAHSNLIYTLHLHPGYDAGMIHDELRRWNQLHAKPLAGLIRPHNNNRDPERRLRIGYVSADFYDHASAFFLLPLFRNHDREQFDLFCYAEIPQSNVVAQQMRDEVQHWRTTHGLTEEATAQLIRNDQIDILVDLKLHTSGNRLLVFAQKPAPVQVTWLGYPGTTDLDTIDYRITDPHLDPPGLKNDEVCERPIHLPETFWCYDPLTSEPAPNPPPCLESGFVTFGCLNTFSKVNQQVLQLWARVLNAVDRSRLIILCPEGSHRQPLLDLLQRDGIDPDRIDLIGRRPRPQYLELYHRIDVGLDTFPYNGHTTSLDSFWMGVPVITLVGNTPVGRAGLSQLNNLALPELIAHTPEQYVQIAAGLANDLPRLTELRRTLRPRMQASPLMDAPRFARNIEAAYREIWRSWCATGGRMTLQQRLDSGYSHYRAGRLAEAEKIYREILAQHPNNPDALHLLGLLAGRLGKLDAAVELIQRAIAIHPNNAPYHNSLGNALKAKGQPAQAVASYRDAIRLEPEFADAHNNLGTVLSDMGQLDAAIDSYRQAIRLKPDLAQAHNNLGNALRNVGQFDAAIASYQQAVRFGPDFPEVYNNLGATLLDQKRLDEAIAAFAHAIRIKPDFVEAHSNLGNALNDKGQLDEAIAAYAQAIRINPDYADAYYNLGNALKGAERLDEAIASYRQALRVNPKYVDAHNNLGNALSGKGQYAEAINCYWQAIGIDPHAAEAQSNLGNAFKDLGQLDEASASYRQAVRLNPDLANAHSNLIYALQFHPGYDAEMIHNELRLWNRRHGEPLRKFIQPHTNDPNPDRRLRVGYVSPDFRDHVVGQNLLPLLREHDHGQIEIFCYANMVQADAMTEQIRGLSDVWRSIARLSDSSAVDLIRQDRIDILVDLSLHTAHNRLLVFARKPAPVQVSYLGYCSSTGLEAMDYRLSDPYMDPPDSDLSLYSEKTIRLPETYWCYNPRGPTPEPSPPPVEATGHITFGCLNNFAKVSPALELWTEILQRVPQSRLIVHSPPGEHLDVIRRRFTGKGISLDRVEFPGRQPWPAYVRTYSRIDIALDPFPWGGGITTCDALWMGVPVVSLIGRTAVGRGGASILANIGLPELIAQTPEQYVAIATNLAGDLPQLAELRRTLRSRMLASPLMDAPRFARSVEATYRQMWRNWRRQSV